MKPPLSRALDSTLHRHLAQLAVTRELLVRELMHSTSVYLAL